MIRKRTVAGILAVAFGTYLALDRAFPDRMQNQVTIYQGLTEESGTRESWQGAPPGMILAYAQMSLFKTCFEAMVQGELRKVEVETTCLPEQTMEECEEAHNEYVAELKEALGVN